MWGQSNRTARELGKEVDYRAVLPDLEAALEWPPLQGLPSRSIVWGSSYSAALVFLLAAKHPSAVAAVMAFSPGEYLGDNHSVRDAARKSAVSGLCHQRPGHRGDRRCPRNCRSRPGSAAVQFIRSAAALMVLRP